MRVHTRRRGCARVCSFCFQVTRHLIAVKNCGSHATIRASQTSAATAIALDIDKHASHHLGTDVRNCEPRVLIRRNRLNAAEAMAAGTEICRRWAGRSKKVRSICSRGQAEHMGAEFPLIASSFSRSEGLTRCLNRTSCVRPVSPRQGDAALVGHGGLVSTRNYAPSTAATAAVEYSGL